jgi:uncharacterized membrane protein YvbJ
MNNKMTMIVARPLSLKSEDIDIGEDPDFLNKRSKKRKTKIIIYSTIILILIILVIVLFLILKKN